jgi:hypothetical protein
VRCALRTPSHPSRFVARALTRVLCTQYYWRINRITDPDEDARFEDKFGPLFLVFMVIVVCSVAIMISINRFSWSHYSALIKEHEGGAGGAVPTAGDAPAAGAPVVYAQQQQQQQPQQFGGRSSMMLRQTNTGVRLGPLSWGIAGFCCSATIAIMVTSQSPLFVMFRRQLWHQVQGVRAGDDEDELLLGSSMGAYSWSGADGGGVAGYGSAKASDVPAFEAARPPPASAVVVSGGAFQRLPHANAVRQRWDRVVATMMPEGRARLRTSPQVPYGLV